jgi:hypothetical protein
MCAVNTSESLNELNRAITRFGVSVEETTLSVKEFSDVLESIKGRYHPIIWWIYEVRESMRQSFNG